MNHQTEGFGLDRVFSLDWANHRHLKNAEGDTVALGRRGGNVPLQIQHDRDPRGWDANAMPAKELGEKN